MPLTCNRSEPSNAFAPMVTMLSGIYTLVMVLFPWNAPSPMVVTI